MLFKKYRKFMVTALCTAMIGGTVLTGCGAATAEAGTANVIDSEITGTVSSVSGSTVSLTLNQGGGMGGPSGQAPSGNPPEKPGSGNSSGSSSSEKGSPSNSDNSSSKNGSSSNSGSSSSENSSSSNSGSGNAGNSGAGASSENGKGQGMPGGSSDSSKNVTVKLDLSDVSSIKDSSSKTASVSDIEKGDTLTVTLDEDGNITNVVINDSGSGSGSSSGNSSGTPGGAPGGSSAGVTSYSAANKITKNTTTSGKTYSSTGKDENAVLVSNGAKAALKKAKITRTSSSSTGGDNSSFYGVGAAALVTDGTLNISGSKITTNAKGAAGVFAYNKGTAYVSDTTINTKKDTSGGIHVAGGGKLYAWNLKVTTAGESSAAIRSDRGGGTMVVDKGTYTSKGTGSPAVYCTADITVNKANLTATNSEAVCIEGLNTLRLYNCNLTGNMPDNDQNDSTWTVILYQSMSGDSEEGNSTFSMKGGSLTSKNGGLFYTTNTESTFYLNDVDIAYSKDNDYFLRVSGNNNKRGWGTSGKNGADTNFTADDQDMKGKIIYDSISNLDFYMENGSTLKGSFTDDETYAGNGGNGSCNVYISKDSKWTVTGNSTVTNLYNASGKIKDASGKTVTIKSTSGKVYVKGNSKYTITVKKYSTKVSFKNAAKVKSYKTYKVSKPGA